jgi:hypothetical protein
MTQHRRRGSGTLAAIVTVAFLGAGQLLTGCGSDDDTAGPADPEPTSASDTESELAEPETTETPSVEPATGPVLRPETGGITIRLPKGWKPVGDFHLQVDGVGPGSRGMILVSSLPSLNPDMEIEQLARIARKYTHFRRGLIRPTMLLRGVQVYHLVDRATNPREEEFGTLLGGDLLAVKFDLHDIPQKQRQPLIESVLASLRWE